MSGENLSPRQQMIGLMYLVLLAMLAMNASKDLLNAFVFLEDGIDVTTSNFNNGNHSVYKKIESAAALGSSLAVTTEKKSKVILKNANEIFDLIENYKAEIIELGGGVDEETNIPLGKDNEDVGAEFILTKGKGEELKKKLEAYKDSLLSFVSTTDTAVIASINKLLETPEYTDYEDNTVSWESNISEHLPLAAVTANLTNIQSYVRNAESQIINYLYEEISSDTYKVNKILATSVSKSPYVLQGDNYAANVFLAAADTTQEPIIIVGDYDTTLFRTERKIKFLGPTDTLPVNGGVGDYNIKTDITGNHTWGGIMKVPHPNPKRKGEFLTYPFVNNYTVAAPSVVISSKDLNIMYKGIGNKIDVSAPGISSDKLTVRANGCSVRSLGNGEYEFTPNRLGKITIEVLAEIKPGQLQPMGKQDWKAKPFPMPLLFLGSKERPSKLRKNSLIAYGGVNIKYSDDFPISSRPRVVKCTMSTMDRSGSISTATPMPNGKFNQSQMNIIRNLAVGARVFIVVSAKGPDGRTHKLAEHTITIIR